jgi:hypothetical protein
MGHFHDTVKAIGKTKRDAQNNACDDFLRENGERYDIRDVKALRYIRDVPPKKWVETGTMRINGRTEKVLEQKEELDAPREKWLGEWEFEIHSHA